MSNQFRTFVIGITAALLLLLVVSVSVEADDEYEENDRKEDAAEVDEGEYEDLWCQEDDDDWYKVSLDEGDDITVTIRFDGDEADLDMRLEDEDGNELDSSEGTGDEETVKTSNVEYTGYYYVKVYSFDGEGGYEMEVTFEYEIPEGYINVVQGTFTIDFGDGLQNDARFLAHVKDEGVPGVEITIYERSSGDKIASGTTQGNGGWENKNMSNGEYRWDAYYDGEKIDYGEFDVSTGSGGRNIQGYGYVGEDDDDDNHNDLLFWTYDNEWNSVEGEEVRIYYESNNTLYASGVTNEDGEFTEKNMTEDNFTFTIAHDSTIYNSGWCHIYNSSAGEPDYDEWFESHSHDTRDTGEDGKPDTIQINYDPNTEGDEVNITVWISIKFESSGESYNVDYTIRGEEVDDFFEEYTAYETGTYDFEIGLRDDQGNEEDYFEINDVRLYRESKTIFVDDDAPAGGNGSKDRPFNNIQDGVDNATDGDTVRVFDGTYYENVVVNKTVNLSGNGSADTTIDGRGEWRCCENYL